MKKELERDIRGLISEGGISLSDCSILLNATKGCRPDMHEPDEQDVRAYVENTDGHFDNAGVGGELTLVLTANEGESDYKERRINMANLVALARIGARVILEKAGE